VAPYPHKVHGEKFDFWAQTQLKTVVQVKDLPSRYGYPVEREATMGYYEGAGQKFHECAEDIDVNRKWGFQNAPEILIQCKPLNESR
jgi:hypothetical protein